MVCQVSADRKDIFILADVSDIFYFFFCFGGGEKEEESEAKRGGTFIWKSREGGVSRRGGGVVHTGAGRVSRGVGGGLIHFFSGPKCPPSHFVMSIVVCLINFFDINWLGFGFALACPMLIWLSRSFPAQFPPYRHGRHFSQ